MAIALKSRNFKDFREETHLLPRRELGNQQLDGFSQAKQIGAEMPYRRKRNRRHGPTINVLNRNGNAEITHSTFQFNLNEISGEYLVLLLQSTDHLSFLVYLFSTIITSVISVIDVDL